MSGRVAMITDRIVNAFIKALGWLKGLSGNSMHCNSDDILDSIAKPRRHTV